MAQVPEYLGSIYENGAYLQNTGGAWHAEDSDWLLTGGAVEVPKYFRTRALNVLRRPVGKISPKIAARLLGGYSILVLAE